MTPFPPLTTTPASGSDLAACTRLMRGGSKSFFAASRLLPPRVRAPAVALYAFCRVADDAIDTRSDPCHALGELRDRLDWIYAGTPLAVDADRALAAVVAAHALPRALLDALLEGFAWDALGRDYETLEDLHAYGARVAGTVGALMAMVMMGVRSPSALARAAELGVAMQLTNIARDVGEDARRGRLYLPRAWLHEAGIDAAGWLRDPVFSPALGRVVQRLLAEADRLYRRAEHGVAALPRDCRAAIHAARLIYAEIGRELERRGLDSVSQRAVVRKPRQLQLLARAAAAAVVAPAPLNTSLPALPAVQFLVDAAVRKATPPSAQGGFYERTLWVLELFEKVAERDRLARAGPV